MESHQKTPLADPVRLETIDKLFEFNIGEYVALPQILVVGDQSSGKSSVLEGLTQLPFPRDSGLCTRFATKITFRRAQGHKTAVSIIPPENATKEHAEKLRSWKKDDLGSLDGETFSEILREVYPLMGLDGSEKDTKKTFSDDVLQIDIQGPEQEHLSVIDVPGIFKNTTPGLTTKLDMIMVKNMVSGYMKNPRAAILAIIPANVDIATQEILEIAKEHDPKGQRTFGVLTKPDLVDKGAEKHVTDIVEGKNHQLGLGWCIVRNLGQKESLDSDSNRNELEESVGIEALQTRLRETLAEIVQREFPGVKSDIQKRLSSCRQQLDALGPSRENRERQQKYLFDLAIIFQKISTLALEARYGGDEIFEILNDLNLATAIVTRNERFSAHFNGLHHAVGFDSKNDDLQVESLGFRLVDGCNEFEIRVSSQRYTDYPAELNDLLDMNYVVKVQKINDILPWLRTMYRSSRGFELGSFDAALVPLIWKKISANWDAMALGYISDVIVLVHRFMLSLLQAICPDENVLNGLTSALMELLLIRYQRAVDHVKFILQVERMGTPLTLNHYFNENLEKCREARVKSALQDNPVDFSGRLVLAVDDIYRQVHMSNTDHVVRDLHDILKPYYQVARKRFVDEVCMQAADFYLVAGPDTPTKIFSPGFVTDLSPEQLQKIAGETSTARRKRAELQREIKNLEEGKKILV